MEMLKTGEFLELTKVEMEETIGGDGLGLGDWISDYFDRMGEALHDAFGCYKCGLHFF